MPARQALFSPDGEVLATSSASGAIVIRRTSDWRPVRTLRQQGGTASLAFTADGRHLLAGGYDGVVRSWDIANGREGRAFAGASGTIWSLSTSPDGRTLAAAGQDGTIRLWPLDLAAPPVLLRGHDRNVWEVRFSPDGQRLASGSFDETVRVWNVATGRPLAVLRAPTEAVVGLDWTPDGSLLASGGDDSILRFWRSANFALVRAVDAGNHLYDLDFSNDGRWLATSGRARGSIGTLWHQLGGGGGEATPVRLWRVDDGAPVAGLPHPDDVMFVDFSPNGHWLVTASEDGHTRLWRLRPGRG